MEVRAFATVLLTLWQASLHARPWLLAALPLRRVKLALFTVSHRHASVSPSAGLHHGRHIDIQRQQILRRAYPARVPEILCHSSSAFQSTDRPCAAPPSRSAPSTDLRPRYVHHPRKNRPRLQLDACNHLATNRIVSGDRYAVAPSPIVSVFERLIRMLPDPSLSLLDVLYTQVDELLASTHRVVRHCDQRPIPNVSQPPRLEFQELLNLRPHQPPRLLLPRRHDCGSFP